MVMTALFEQFLAVVLDNKMLKCDLVYCNMIFRSLELSGANM